jgi:cell division GTPase FtsZ
MKQIRVSAGKGKYKITLVAVATMDGLIVSLVGGEKPHVGAVAISIPRPSLKNSSKFSATTSIFTITGHKDDELAKPVAERLAKEFTQTVVVIAGVHIDRASDDDIRKLVYNSEQAVKNLLKKMKSTSIK